MTMGWQKLSAFVDNCRVEHCMRKGSGKCRATLHVFEKVSLTAGCVYSRRVPFEIYFPSLFLLALHGD